ncbi:MAG: glycoside-pentoside-hexuronide (GPH):cation symporter [Treponema sp.]|jgi:GPH family glycoside/pentoside/hexuronide:cation symporter|nr:glycoside-pentoside-hexuronide (GPH):cation symporter [Treponema sp.]
MLTLKQKMSYASGDIASCLISHPIIFYFMFYCTNMLGIPLMAVGTLMFLCRFWDAANDLIIGALIDRTHSRTGKVHPWLKAFIIPTSLFMWLMFAAPKGAPMTMKILWVSAAYMIYTWCFTACNLGYGAILPLMTKDQKDRSLLATFRFFGVYIGMYAVQLGMLPLVALIGDNLLGGDRTYGYTIVTSLYAVLGGIFFVVLYRGCHEKVYLDNLAEDEKRGITLEDRKREESKKKAASIFKDVSYLGRNMPWMIVFGVTLISFTLQGISGTPNMYFLIYYIKMDETYSSLLMVINMLPGLLMMPFVPKIIGKWGYKGPGLVGMGAAIIRFIASYFLGTNIVGITILGFISGFFGATMGIAGIAMISDALEYGDWKFDRRLEGLGTAAYSFSTKAGPALGGIIATSLLALVSLDTSLPRGADQSPEAIAMIRFTMFILPAIITAVQFVLMALYPLSKEKYAQIVKEIEVRNKARAEAATLAPSAGV